MVKMISNRKLPVELLQNLSWCSCFHLRYSVSFCELFPQRAKMCSQRVSLKKPVFCFNSVCLLCLTLTAGCIPAHHRLPGAYSLKAGVGGKCQFFSSLYIWCLWVFLYSYHFYKKLWTMGWGSVAGFFCSYAFKKLSLFGRKQSLVCIVFLLSLEGRNVSGFPVL